MDYFHRDVLGPVAALRRSSELVRGHFEVVFLTAAFAVIVEEAVTDVGALVGLLEKLGRSVPSVRSLAGDS